MTSRERVLRSIAHKEPDKVPIDLGAMRSTGISAIADILPDLIEAGVEIINPVQTSCRGMEPGRLKREFGRDVTFWGGGCDTQAILPAGTPKEIDRHVRERIEILAPGGGFVFCQVHNILPNVPPENVVAMYDAVKKYR